MYWILHIIEYELLLVSCDYHPWKLQVGPAIFWSTVTRVFLCIAIDPNIIQAKDHTLNLQWISHIIKYEALLISCDYHPWNLQCGSTIFWPTVIGVLICFMHYSSTIQGKDHTLNMYCVLPIIEYEVLLISCDNHSWKLHGGPVIFWPTVIGVLLCIWNVPGTIQSMDHTLKTCWISHIFKSKAL